MSFLKKERHNSGFPFKRYKSPGSINAEAGLERGAGARALLLFFPHFLQPLFFLQSL